MNTSLIHRPISVGLLVVALLSGSPLVLSATAQEPAAAGARQANPSAPLPNPVRNPMPVPVGALDGVPEWLNTPGPLTLQDLRGKVVLLDFWTYCCINCIHILPDLKYLENKYADQLVVIGVHSAKFANERLTANIRDAILRYEIQHPVANDNDLLLWRRFSVNTWPTVVLIDPEGNFAGALSGEGHRDTLDRNIGRLVEYHRSRGTLDETPMVFDLEAQRAAASPLRFPGKVFADAASDRLFISDSNHNRIVVTRLNGELLEIIGSGRMGAADGSFAEAEFDHPQGTVLVGDMLYVADTENHLLRAVDLQRRTVATLAGTGRQGPFGRGGGGRLRSTSLNSPWSLAHVQGTLFIAMAGPHQIWSHQLGTDRIARYAGSGVEDVTNGPLNRAAFAQPSELVSDPAGQFLYVVDSEGSAIRKVPTNGRGLVTTVAGTSELPQGQSLFAFGDVDGTGAAARFQHPLGIACDGSRLFVADSYNHKIRTVDLKTLEVRTWLGNGQAGSALQPPQLSEPGGIALAGGRLFIADTNNHRVCVADVQSGEMSELLIPGLTPPTISTPRGIPDDPPPTTVEPQTVSVADGSGLSVLVDLAVPPGHKLNELAPVTWEVYSAQPQSLIPADVLGQRDAASVEKSLSGVAARFELPLAAGAGQAELLIFVNYSYCAENSSLCRLAAAAWRVPVTVQAAAASASDDAAVQLKFPGRL